MTPRDGAFTILQNSRRRNDYAISEFISTTFHQCNKDSQNKKVLALHDLPLHRPTQTAKTFAATSGALLDAAFEELFEDAFEEFELELA